MEPVRSQLLVKVLRSTREKERERKKEKERERAPQQGLTIKGASTNILRDLAYFWSTFGLVVMHD